MLSAIIFIFEFSLLFHVMFLNMVSEQIWYPLWTC